MEVSKTIATIKSGTKIAGEMFKTSKSMINNAFGNLEEQCLPKGANFDSISGAPVRIVQKFDFCKEIANELDNEGIKIALQDIIEQYTAPLYKILFVGHYSVGKSSIINALLGKDLLPTDTAPTTKVLTWLMYGKEDMISFEAEDGTTQISTVEKLKDMSTDNPLNSARNIFITADNDFLESGVAIIDSPGLQDNNQEISNLTIEAFEGADLIVYVVDEYLANSDRQWLSYLAKHGKVKNLFVVINKIDLIDEEETSLREFIDDKTSELTSLNIAANIYPISARDKKFEDKLNKFRTDLANFMRDGLQASRDASIEGNLNQLLDCVEETCNSAKQMQSENEEKKQKTLAQLREKIKDKQFKLDLCHKQIINTVDTCENRMRVNWEREGRHLKEKILSELDQATSEQLQKTNVIEDLIYSEVSKFFATEVEDLQNSINNFLQQEYGALLENDSMDLSPIDGETVNIGTLKRSGLSKIPAGLIPTGLVLLSYSLTGGIIAPYLAALKTAIFASLFSDTIKSFWVTATESFDIFSQKKQIVAKLEEVFPRLDSAVKEKIHEVCQIVKGQVGKCLEQNNKLAYTDEDALIKMLDNAAPNASLEKLDSWIKKINIIK